MRLSSLRIVGVSLAAISVSVSVPVPAFCAAKTTVSFMGWTTCAEDVAMYKELFATFEKAHPDIKIKNLNVTWAGDLPYLTKLLVMATASVMPDVVNIPYLSMPRIASSGIIAPANPYLARDKSVRATDWQDAGISACTWEGKLWALPYDGSDWWNLYNRKLFAEAGLPDPEDVYAGGGWTFDAMMMSAQKLSKYQGDKFSRVGLVQMSDSFSVEPYILGMGGSVMSPSGDACTLDKKAAIDGLSYAYDAVWVNRAMSLGGAPSGIGLDGAKQEKWAMVAWWSSLASWIQSQKVKWPMNQVPFPAGPVSARTNITQFDGVGMAKQSKHKDEAWTLMKFMSGKEAARILATNAWLTTRKDSVATYVDIMSRMGITGLRFAADAQARMVPSWRTAKVDTVMPKIDTQLAKAWTKKLSVAQAAAAAAKDATAEIVRGRKK